MAVITIAREMGSDGDKLGADLAESLGYELLNKEIIREVAERTGASTEEIDQYDERTDNLVVRFLSRIFMAHPDMAAYYSTFAYVEPNYIYGVAEPYVFYQMPPGQARGVDPEHIVEKFESIIRDVAEKGNVVIIGRASQCVLKDTPGAVHLRTIAPLEWRIENVIRDNPDLSPEDAENLIDRNDRWRERYLSVNYHADWRDPLLYNATISMDRWPDRSKLVDCVRGLV